MIICLGGLLVLSYTIGNKFETNIPFLVMLAFEGIVIICTWASIIKEKKEKFCNQCKRQYDFEEDVEYREINRYTKTYNYNPNNVSKQKIESLSYKIAFDCTCKNCNTKK